MNYKDWLQKYYPIPASEVKGTDIDLIDHCINKWEGLKDAESYALRFMGDLFDQDSDVALYVDGNSCALCCKYYDHDWFEVAEIDDCIEEDEDYPDHPCTKCPLARSLGRPCDSDDGENEGVFFQARMGYPQIMIDSLKIARAMVENETQ